MGNSKHLWQLMSLVLALALIGALIALHRSNNASHPATGTLTTINRATNLEHLALSPNARRAHERYSL